MDDIHGKSFADLKELVVDAALVLRPFPGHKISVEVVGLKAHL